MEREKHSKILREDFPMICRCCLSKSATSSILELEFENTSFSEILECLFYTEIKNDDELPKNICTKCIAQVVTYFQFKKMFDIAEVTLLSVIEQSEEQSTVKFKSRFTEINHEDLTEDDREDSLEEWYDDIVPTSDGKKLQLGTTTQENPPKSTSPNTNDAKTSKTSQNILCTCLEAFATNTHYLAHKRRQTEKKKHVRLFHCELCNKYFKRNRFIVHERFHTNERPYKCKLCPKTYADPGGLMRHKKSHSGVKPYVCEKCGKAFSLSTTLQLHREGHSEEKQFLCSVCGKQFLTRPAFRAHLATHGIGNTKKILCSSCGKSFVSRSTLKEHSYTHTGEKPFACPFCDKKFRTTSARRFHCRVHMDDRPFACFICDKRYVQNHQLQNHLKTHGEESA